MNQTLNEARDHVLSLIENDTVPASLVGDLSAMDVSELAKQLTSAYIREHLSEGTENMDSEEMMELIQQVMESVASTVGLICVQAALTAAVEQGLVGVNEDAALLTLTADDATDMVKSLLTNGTFTLTLTVE